MSFLKLTVNSQRVALPDDFVIRMVYKMPYPFLENIPGAITYWFNLPSNDINDIIFKHANFIYVVDELKVFTCLLEIGSIQLTGELYMKNASNQEYKLFIAFRETLENFGKKKLSQVVQGTSNLGASTAAIIDNAETMQEQNYPNVDYGFPAIINTEFFDDNPEFKGIMNNWDYNYGGYWPNYYDSAKDKTINRNVLVPQPYLLSVLDKAFENIGFDVCGYLHNSGKFNKMVLYSNYALEKYSSIDYFLGGENSCQYNANGTQYYIDIDAVVKDEDNTFNLSTNTYSSSKSTLFWVKFRCEARYFGTNPTGATFSLYLVDGSSIIGQVGTDVVTNTISHYEFETSVNRSSPSLKVFLSSNSALSDSYVRCTSIELEIYPGIDINVDKFSGNIDLKNHVPDLSVSDFLNGIVKKFCQASFFDFHNKSLELVSWNDIIDSSEYIDLTSYVIKDSEKLNFDFKKFSLLTSWNDDSLTSGNFIFENNQNMTIVNEFLSTFPTPTLDGQLLFVSPLNLVLIAEFNVKGKLQWNYKSDYFQDVVNNTLEEEEVNIPISSLLCREVVKNQVYYPAIGQKGSSTKNGVNSAGFKVFNNHGIKNTTYYQYPYATSSNLGINGNNLGGLDLNMSGDTGLYNTLHKKFYDYISARKSIEGFFDIEEHTLHDLINIYKARNEIWKVRVGSQNYLPEVLDISIGLDAIKSCKITLR